MRSIPVRRRTGRAWARRQTGIAQGPGCVTRPSGLALLAAASAAVSFAAQYRMVYAVRRLAVVAGLEAAIPDTAALVFACLGIAVALRGRRGDPGPGAERRRGRDERVHERDRRGPRVAEPGDLGDASGRLRACLGHADQRRPHRRRPPGRAGRGRRDTAGDRRRIGPVAAAPGPGTGLDADRLPVLGPGRVPGRPRSQSRPRSGRPPCPQSRTARPADQHPWTGTRARPSTGVARRQPGSSRWSSSGTARWPASRSPKWRGSALTWRRRPILTRVRRGPRCAAPSCPLRTRRRVPGEVRHCPGRRPACPRVRVVGVLTVQVPAR